MGQTAEQKFARRIAEIWGCPCAGVHCDHRSRLVSGVMGNCDFLAESRHPVATSYRLLMTYLTTVQKRSLLTYGEFETVGSDGRIYCISAFAPCYNVRRGLFKYCAAPNDVPVFDMVLGQLLALRTNARGFLRIANRV